MTNTKKNANLLDEPVPDIKVPVLAPQPATSYFERLSKYASDKRESVKKYAKNKQNRWFDRLTDYIPPIPNVVDKAFQVVKKNILKFYKPFEIIESKSALKKFTVVYTIEGQKGYDERSFLNAVKQTVIDLLRGHYETKVQIILHCIMERYKARSGEIITANPAFHSNIMINVKGSEF